MLLIVCPNLAVDRILEVPDFRTSTVQRSASTIVQPGGKGSNVARVFRQLGGEVVLVGFAGRQQSSWMTSELKSSAVEVSVIEAYEDTRVCTIILDTTNQRHPTVINEDSMSIETKAAERLLQVVDDLLPRATAMLATGSLARGLAPDFYRDILGRAKSLGKFAALDAAGPALVEGVRARPDLLKVNAQELGELAGVSGPNTRNVLAYLSSEGSDLARHIAVTFGDAGAILNVDHHFWQATPPEVFTTNPIGAGDAFAAGYIGEFLKTGNVGNAFRWALAAAASDAATVRPGDVVASDVQSMASMVHVDQL